MPFQTFAIIGNCDVYCLFWRLFTFHIVIISGGTTRIEYGCYKEKNQQSFNI